MRTNYSSLIFLFLVTVMLASCNTGGRFASSFGKRKYTRGYYVDAPGEIKKPAEQVTQIAANANKSISLEAAKQTKINSTTYVPISKTEASTLAPEKKVHSVLTNAIPVNLKKIQTDVIYRPGKEPSPSEGAVEKTSGDVNYFAIIGLALAIAGVIITVIDGFLPILATVLLIAGAIVCIYSLFLNKIYWTWLAIVGLAMIIFLFTLILL